MTRFHDAIARNEGEVSRVFVSGGSRGIGRAIAERFHRAGCAVAVCARDASALDALQEACPGIATYVCDMADPDAVAALATSLIADCGRFDLLVNNSGAYLPGQLHAEPTGALERMLEANLWGAYRLTRALLPAMIERRSGTVINVCSTASIMPYVNGGSYCIAKHALYGFSRTLREEMKPHGVRVISLLPGATLTDSWKGVDLPPERLMPAEDVAEMAWAAWSMSPRTVIEEIVMRPQLGDIA
jgi:NAD(P)-dependent dehydrogenase (short-subunit alcohol dehydrogenase family)